MTAFLLESTSPSKFPEIRVNLCGNLSADQARIADIEVFQDSVLRIAPIDNFEHAGLHPVMLRNVKLSGYEVPTPIQKYCIPAIRMGYDLIAIAQTGEYRS